MDVNGGGARRKVAEMLTDQDGYAPRQVPRSNDLAERGSVLPIGRDIYGGNHWAVPGMIKSPVDAFWHAGDAGARGDWKGAGYAGAEAAGAAMTGALAMPRPAGSIGMSGTPKLPIKAFHGSPHDFDKFELSPKTIGTGEGAQAFGHGLYFAENEGVAQSYRPTKWQPEYSLNGRNLNDVYDQAVNRQDYGAAAVLERIMLHEPRARIEQYFAGSDEGAQARRALQYLKTLPDDVFAKPAGRMYEVDIHADPAAMLNLDAPIGKQPAPFVEMVRDGLKSYGYLRPKDNGPRVFSNAVQEWRLRNGGMSNDAMSSILHGRGDLIGKTPEQVSQNLKDAGVPAARYFDQGSRDRQRGTRNFVLFRDDIIDIVKKYGIAAAASMYGMDAVNSAVDGAQQ